MTSDFISGLPTSITTTATSTASPQIIFVTGCNTCSSSSNSGAATTGIVLLRNITVYSYTFVIKFALLASIVSTTNEDQSQLSSNDLGAIIGGCAGGLVVIIIATVFFCIRRRKRKDFYTGPDFPTTAVMPPIVDDVKQTYPALATTTKGRGTSIKTHLMRLLLRQFA